MLCGVLIKLCLVSLVSQRFEDFHVSEVQKDGTRVQLNTKKLPDDAPPASEDAAAATPADGTPESQRLKDEATRATLLGYVGKVRPRACPCCTRGTRCLGTT